MTAEPGPTFPPLLRGEETPPGVDPFARAVAEAALGADPGLVCWARDPDQLNAAVVFAPEKPLAEAMGVVFAVALGLGDALGALAPPEVAVHYLWPSRFKVNGADCGGLYAAASTENPDDEPDWLVVGILVPYARRAGDEPGHTPGDTCLAEEGCLDVTPLVLLESWSRHMLVWINRWLTDGFEPLHAAWRARAWGIGEPTPGSGIFLGLDEHGGMLARVGDATSLHPLTLMLENPA